MNKVTAPNAEFGSRSTRDGAPGLLGLWLQHMANTIRGGPLKSLGLSSRAPFRSHLGFAKLRLGRCKRRLASWQCLASWQHLARFRSGCCRGQDLLQQVAQLNEFTGAARAAVIAEGLAEVPLISLAVALL